MTLIDVVRINTHGGSIRCVVKNRLDKTKIKSVKKLLIWKIHYHSIKVIHLRIFQINKSKKKNLNHYLKN